MEVLKFDRSMPIANLAILPHGTGAKYLECIRSHNGEFIAKQWRNEKPATFDVLIQFKGWRNGR